MTLSTLSGLGEKREKILNEIGVYSLEALFLYVPKSYDYHYLNTPDVFESRYFEATVIHEAKIAYIRKNLKKLTCKVKINHQEFTLGLFNQVHWKRHLLPGTKIVIYGTLNTVINAQKIYLKKTFLEGIIPRYKIKGIPDKTLQKWLKECVNSVTFKEDIDSKMCEKYQLLDKKTLYQTLHFPQSNHELDQAFYTQKVRFMIAYLTQRKQNISTQKKPIGTLDDTKLQQRLESLPFDLTPEQKTALDEGLRDLFGTKSTRRLIQGDTGSGKTVVAMLLALTMLDQGFQVAFMAPTEVLAMQHFKTYQRFFSAEPYQSALLSGGLEKTEMTSIKKGLNHQTIDLVFGTHVLFSNTVSFNHLGLVIIDEEQRFGVDQKHALLTKGDRVDYIALSATPIPRTLALILYQDMDVTSIMNVPKSRKSVKTEVIPLKDARFLDPMIDLTLKEHKQVFIIAPRIEDDDQLLSVERIEKYYKKTFKNATIEVLHGKMSNLEKNQILKTFQENQIDILISTTVVEVGIDVKEATLMLIYHAERFGYSALHQLRGRLGRHNDQGTCYMLFKGNESVKKRLNVLKSIHDGFELSRIDLEERGFGSLFGSAQSGFTESTHWPYHETLELLSALKHDLDAN